MFNYTEVHMYLNRLMSMKLPMLRKDVALILPTLY